MDEKRCPLCCKTYHMVTSPEESKALNKLSGKELKRDIEFSIVQNAASSAGSTTVPRSSAGLESMIAGNRVFAASNNTTGSILAVRWDQWRFGYKRMMNFEIQREPLSDSTLIVVNMRVGMINRDNEASAISYNVTPL